MVEVDRVFFVSSKVAALYQVLCLCRIRCRPMQRVRDARRGPNSIRLDKIIFIGVEPFAYCHLTRFGRG